MPYIEIYQDLEQNAITFAGTGPPYSHAKPSDNPLEPTDIRLHPRKTAYSRETMIEPESSRSADKSRDQHSMAFFRTKGSDAIRPWHSFCSSKVFLADSKGHSERLDKLRKTEDRMKAPDSSCTRNAETP
jgi:hypothetical protein